MRGPGVLFVAALVVVPLVTGSPASAEEPTMATTTPPTAPTAATASDAAHAPPMNVDELVRRGDELARLRGRGTTRVVIGAVMLGFGLVLGGISTVMWTAGDGATGYANQGFNSYYQGAVAMDTIAFGLIGGGTALVAIGAGNIVEGKRPRLYLGASSLATHF